MPKRVLAVQPRNGENGSIKGLQNFRNREFGRFLGKHIATLCTSHTGDQSRFLHGMKYLLQKSRRYSLPSCNGFCLDWCGARLHGKVDRRQDSISRSKGYLHTTVFRSELREVSLYPLSPRAVKLLREGQIGTGFIFWIMQPQGCVPVLRDAFEQSRMEIHRTQVDPFTI